MRITGCVSVSRNASKFITRATFYSNYNNPSNQTTRIPLAHFIWKDKNHQKTQKTRKDRVNTRRSYSKVHDGNDGVNSSNSKSSNIQSDKLNQVSIFGEESEKGLSQVVKGKQKEKGKEKEIEIEIETENGKDSHNETNQISFNNSKDQIELNNEEEEKISINSISSSSQASTSSSPSSSYLKSIQDRIQETHSEILFNLNRSLNHFDSDEAFDQFKNLLDFQHWTFQLEPSDHHLSSGTVDLNMLKFKSIDLISPQLFQKLLFSIDSSTFPRFQINLKRLMILMNFGEKVIDSLKSEIVYSLNDIKSSSSLSRRKEEQRIENLGNELKNWNTIILKDETQLYLINQISKCVRKIVENEVLEAITKIIELREKKSILENQDEIEISLKEKFRRKRKKSLVEEEKNEKFEIENQLEKEELLDDDGILGFFQHNSQKSGIVEVVDEENIGVLEKEKEKEREKGEEEIINLSKKERLQLSKEMRSEIKIIESLLSIISKSIPYRYSPLNPKKIKAPERSSREDQLDLFTRRGIEENQRLIRIRESLEEFQERKIKFLEESQEIEDGKQILLELSQDLEKLIRGDEIENESSSHFNKLSSSLNTNSNSHQSSNYSSESTSTFPPKSSFTSKPNLEENDFLKSEVKNQKQPFSSNPISISDLISRNQKLPNPQILFDHLFRHLISLDETLTSTISSHSKCTNNIFSLPSSISASSLTSFLHISFQSSNFPVFQKILELLKSTGQLEIGHVNLSLWLSARVPISKSCDFFGFGNRKRWRGILMCYKELRSNELKEELRFLRDEKKKKERKFILNERRRRGESNQENQVENPSLLPYENYENQNQNWFPEENGFSNPFSMSKSPMENLLGFKTLPENLKPDLITYSIMISIFSFKGDLFTSLDIFKDLIETEMSFDLPKQISYSSFFISNPSSDRFSLGLNSSDSNHSSLEKTSSLVPERDFEFNHQDETLKILRNHSDKVDKILKESKKLFDANLSIYDSFFRGFAKNSIPSKLIQFNKENEEESQWELLFKDPPQEENQDQEREMNLKGYSENFSNSKRNDSKSKENENENETSSWGNGFVGEEEKNLTSRELGRFKNPWKIQTFFTLFKGFLNLKPISQMNSLDWRDLFLEVLRDEEIELRESEKSFENANGNQHVSLKTLAFESDSNPTLKEALFEIQNFRKIEIVNHDENIDSLKKKSEFQKSKSHFDEEESSTNSSHPSSKLHFNLLYSFDERLPFSTQSRSKLLSKLKSFSKSPTSQQFFHLLTALRRVSNDDPIWSLKQWKKIENKFGLRFEETTETDDDDDAYDELEKEMNENFENDGNSKDESKKDDDDLNDDDDWKEEFENQTENLDSDENHSEKNRIGFNEEGWHSFKLDNRMKRTLNHLRNKIEILKEEEEEE